MEAVTKSDPFTVRVNAGPPAVVELGVILVKVGTGKEVWDSLVVTSTLSNPTDRSETSSAMRTLA